MAATILKRFRIGIFQEVLLMWKALYLILAQIPKSNITNNTAILIGDLKLIHLHVCVFTIITYMRDGNLGY